MKWPMVPVASAYAFGIFLGDLLQPPLAWLFTAALTTAFVTLVFHRCRVLLPAFLLFLTGWTNISWRLEVLAPDDLRHLVGNEPGLAIVRGCLRETPTTRTFQLKDRSVTSFLAELEVAELHQRRNGAWTRASGRILVRTRGEIPDSLFRGQTVQVAGVLGPPPPPLADELFDYPAYLARRGIYFQLNALPEDWVVTSHHSPPLADRLLRWSAKTLAHGLPETDNTYHLLCAMTLGSRDGLTRQVYEPFTRSGTMHVFAISGLHVVLIAGMFTAGLRTLRLPRYLCGWVIIPSLWFYTQITGWQPSAIRATIMMSVVLLGWSLKRPSNLLNSLAAAAFIILLWDPQQLFGASFQLSFFVVLGMALFIPPLEHGLNVLFTPDPLLPKALWSRTRRVAMLPLQWLTRSIATSTAAWIGALPLTLYYFHLASPVALLANLIVIPLSSLALGSNLGALLVGWVSPGVAELLNHSAWFWMVCMVRVSEWAAALPWGYFYLPSLRWYDSVLFYGLLLGWVSGLFHRRWALACFGAGLVLVIGRVGLSLCTYEIIVFPHQAGTVIHCDGPGRGRDLLIDTGVNNLASTVTLPILRARGVNNVPRLLLSHGDARHIGAVELLLLELDPAKIIVGDAPSRSPIYRRVVKELESTPGKLSTVSRGHRIGLFTVLHPDAGDRFPRGDDNAVVLHGRVYGASILLLSDLGSAGQDALLSREPNLRADIIVTSLPANGEPICDELLDRLQPKTILVCDADFPAAERASHRLRQRLARRGIQVFYGSDQGSLRLNFTPWSGGAVKMQRGDLFQFLIP